MKKLLKIIGFVFAAALTLSVINALINPGTRENRNQSTNTSDSVAATNAYLRSTSSSAAAQKVAAIEPTHLPTISPPTPQIVIPTVVDTPEPVQVLEATTVIPTPEPTQAAVVATPRLLKIAPVFDVKSVIGKPVRLVDRVLGKPTGIDEGMEVGEQLRTYNVDGYMVIVAFSANKLGKDVITLLMNRDGFMRADSSLLFRRFGLNRVGAPDREGVNGATWDNVDGFELGIGITEDTFIESVSIALAN